jgi:hypothetical protein
MNDDLEFEQWQSLWQTPSHIPSDLNEMAKKHLRRERIMLLADIGVTIVIGGALIIWAVADRQPSVRFLAVWVWTMLLAAWIFRWFNSGGNWTGTAPNTEVFLEKLRHRYQVSLRNVKFGWVLGSIQFLFNVVWVYRQVSRNHPITIWQFMTLKISLGVWICVALMFVWTIWFFRKLKDELASVERLQREWHRPESNWEEIRKPRKTLKWNLIVQFIRDLTMLPALLDGLVDGMDWNLRRKKKKSWKM